MNLIQRARRGGVVAAVLASVAMAAGAAGVDADDVVIDEPVATAEPTTTQPAPPETTEAPETTEPTEPTEPPSETAPTTTMAPPPSSTTPPPQPPVKGGLPTPADAIATTTTVPAAVEEPVSVVAKPSAPTSPVATPANGSVKVTWKAPASNGGAAIQKYAVQRYNTVSTQWENVAFPTALSYTNTSLSNGTKYSFRVLAYNSAGWSAPSTVVAATPRTVPSAPTALVATPANGSVKLTWKAPSNGGAAIIRYAVQRYNSVSKKWENVAFPPTSPFTNTGVKNGTKYSYRVLAQNAAGWGAPSSVVAATPNGPSAPLSPVATPGNSKVTLTWNAPATSGAAPIKKYAVQRFNTVSKKWENIAFPTTRSYTAFGLNGVKYDFRILAYTDIGWGPASVVVSAVPFTVPGEPYFVQATPEDAYVGLTWSAPPTGGTAIDKYRVRMATSLNGPWQTFEGTQPVTVGGFGSLINGKMYYFQVAAHNKAGWGQYSWTVNAVPRTVPAAPGLTAHLETPAWVKLNWTRPAQNGGAPIGSYRFEQAQDLGGPWTLAATKAVSADMVSGHVYVGGLKPGTTYYFRAAALNAAGQGPYNGITVSVTTPATVPGAPTACSAVQLSSNTMYLDWSAPTSDGGSPIINYNVLIEKGQWKYQVVYVKDWDETVGYWYWDTISIVGHDTVASITARTAVVSPGAYKIFIRARNSMGSGPVCETYVEII